MAFLTGFFLDPWTIWKLHLRICVRCWAKWQPPGVQTTSACCWASVRGACPVGQLFSSVTAPHLARDILLVTDLAPGPQPAPSQHTHYTFSIKTASSSVHFSVLVFKPSISHPSVHIYRLLCARFWTSHHDITLSQRHTVVTHTSRIVAERTCKGRTNKQMCPQVQEGLWGDKGEWIQNLSDMGDPISNNVVRDSCDPRPNLISILCNSQTLSPSTLVLTP